MLFQKAVRTANVPHEARLTLLLRPRERLRSIVMSMSFYMSACLSVCPRGYLRNHKRNLYQIFVHAAYVCGSVLFGHVDDRPHRLSAGRGDGSAQRGRLPCVMFAADITIKSRNLKNKHIKTNKQQ